MVDLTDGRELTDVTQEPYKKIGRLIVMGSQGMQQCSAFELGKWSMLTAAHCITNAGAPPKGGIVQLGFGQNAQGGFKQGQFINIVDFKYQHYNGTVDTDYAAVFLQSPISKPVPFPRRRHDFPLVSGMPTDAIGYPGAVRCVPTQDQYESFGEVFSPPGTASALVTNDMDEGNSGGPIRLHRELKQPIIGIASKFGNSSYNKIHRLNLNNESQVNAWALYQPAGQVAFINAPVNGAAYDIFSVPAFQAQATAFGSAKSAAGDAGKAQTTAGDVSSQVIWKSDLDGVLGSGATLPAEITNQLSVGIHRISAEVMGASAAQSFSAAAVVEISGPTGNLGAASDPCFVSLTDGESACKTRLSWSTQKANGPVIVRKGSTTQFTGLSASRTLDVDVVVDHEDTFELYA